MDENEFFRQATLRICGNLDIARGLQECFNYISQHMPADNLYLERYEMDMSAIRIIAHANQSGYRNLDVLIPLLDEAKNGMKEVSGDKMPSLYICNNPAKDPITAHMLSALQEPLSSVMSLMLFVEDKVAGALTLLARGNDRFEEHHISLYSTLREPFFVAVSNALEHRKVLKLKDLLADDNRYMQKELHRLSGDEITGPDKASPGPTKQGNRTSRRR
ncbi:MAG: hypothetical protein GY702_22840 [Desulfobulbaceae bacterium]|nr:hypothetical protein [Desulfobulbaceae bacterium]